MKLLAKVLMLVSWGGVLAACSTDTARQPADAAPPQSKQATSASLPKPGQANQTMEVDAGRLLKDFPTWYKYAYYNVRLGQDFIGLDADANSLAKADFLKRLASGNFAALKVATRNGVPVYKLFELSKADPGIRSTIQQMATTQQAFSSMEGRQLPGFKFTTVDGTSYTQANSTGKVTVLKCWFIGCVACVAEFPELNELVDDYKGRTDIQFLSLAMDPKEKLVAFLKKKEFKYAVVPNMKQYMTEQLEINQYPTHLLIDRTGTIVKVTGNMTDMRPWIEKITVQGQVAASGTR